MCPSPCSPFNHLTLRQNSFITIIVFQCNIPITEIIGHGHAKAENIIYLDLHDPAPDPRLGNTKKHKHLATLAP